MRLEITEGRRLCSAIVIDRDGYLAYSIVCISSRESYLGFCVEEVNGIYSASKFVLRKREFESGKT